MSVRGGGYQTQTVEGGVYTREERCGDITKNGDGNESIGGVVGVDRTGQRRIDEDDYRKIRRPDAMRAWSIKMIK